MNKFERRPVQWTERAINQESASGNHTSEFLVFRSFPGIPGSASGDDINRLQPPPAAMILIHFRISGLCSKKYGFQCAATTNPAASRVATHDLISNASY